MLVIDRKLLGPDGMPGPELLGTLLRRHAQERVRLDEIGEIYARRHRITSRRRLAGLPNNRLAHPFARYITTMAAGYLAGQPIKYDMDESGTAQADGADAAQTQKSREEALKALEDAYRASNIDSVDSELAKDASIYGKGVCICYVSDRDGASPRAATIDPRTAFVIYDDTVEHNPMMGVHITPRMGMDGRADGVNVDVYTQDKRISFTRGATEGALLPQQETPHFFGGVPIIEFWNNADETGDFEGVISQIDAYDAIQSDRVNDKQQFTDAILKVTGCTLEGDVEYDENGEIRDKRSIAQKLLEEKIIALPDHDASAEWLVKKGDEAGTEILKDAIKADIHKMAMVPDLTDEKFAGNVSGVAMRYKLLGLEQMTATKERWFAEGLRSRMRLFGNLMHHLSGITLDADAVSITFTRSLPVNETEAASMVATLDGMVPDEILLAQLPFVKDVGDALDKLRAQKDEAARAQAQAFGGGYEDANTRLADEQQDEP